MQAILVQLYGTDTRTVHRTVVLVRGSATSGAYELVLLRAWLRGSYRPVRSTEVHDVLMLMLSAEY
jgi:hypothetical protein